MQKAPVLAGAFCMLFGKRRNTPIFTVDRSFLAKPRRLTSSPPSSGCINGAHAAPAYAVNFHLATWPSEGMRQFVTYPALP